MNMDWFLTSIQWYFFLLILGIIFLPLTEKIFGDFFSDGGYSFGKIIGVLFLSYSTFVLGTLKILPFYRESLFLLLVFFLLLNIWLKKKNSFFHSFFKGNLELIIFEELLFFTAFVFWVFVRGQEPSIRSLEKFMDFGFINSILRAKYFPPLDVWLAGRTINYYYFGHLVGAVLIKLINIPSNQGYNLILATLFALGISQTFSLCFNIIYFSFKNLKYSILSGILGSFLVNLGGNLHPIYLFTKGYPNENPIPFWQILSKFNPSKYWYPNATRFIPFTIHEFPIYSYVVADLHGHVFDIPFVLLTLTILWIFFINNKTIIQNINNKKNQKSKIKNKIKNFPITNNQLPITLFLSFLTAVHYMTNAFDGPIYAFLTMIIFFLIFSFTRKFVFYFLFYIFFFIVFMLPFSSYFKPFVSGIGVNCSASFLTAIGKVGPFLFEKGNCQVSPLWMLFVLWGFFWFNFIFFGLFLFIKKKLIDKNSIVDQFNSFILLLFFFGTLLIIIPEFFYIKDIYPAHFRANTMFKLGYQAFIMMSLASSFVFIIFKNFYQKNKGFSLIYFFLFVVQFFLIALYPAYAISSYYGKLDKKPELDGSLWINYQYPEYKEIINYLNQNIQDQPTILEAQGDSYTDFNVVSAYTGLPTVAGWWVHEWLWRGSPEAVGRLIPEIQNIYENEDEKLTITLIKKHKIKYLIIGSNERQKYKNLKENKFEKIGRLIFISSNNQGKIFSF